MCEWTGHWLQPSPAITCEWIIYGVLWCGWFKGYLCSIPPAATGYGLMAVRRGFGESEIITQMKGLALDCSPEMSDTSWGEKSHCRVGLMVITDSYNFMLVYNFIAVFAAKMHSCWVPGVFFLSFLSFYFFSLFLISFIFRINSGACLQPCLGVCMSPHWNNLLFLQT